MTTSAQPPSPRIDPLDALRRYAVAIERAYNEINLILGTLEPEAEPLAFKEGETELENIVESLRYRWYSVDSAKDAWLARRKRLRLTRHR
jgi:hypothetical protein